MSENKQQLYRRFLRAAYDLGEDSPGRMVMLLQVADELQEYLDAPAPYNLGTVGAIAQELSDRGLIKRHADGFGILSITPYGVDAVQRGLVDLQQGAPVRAYVPPDEFSPAAQVGEPPVEIQESLRYFREDHPDPSTVTFIMMAYGETEAHDNITRAIRDGLADHGLTGLRADDRRYHDDLFYNVLTYMHGCGSGVAVFERIKSDAPNPNVALEVGYLYALRKPVCLLKDNTLDTLNSDLVGKLYDPFDTQQPTSTIPPIVRQFLIDKRLSKR